MVIHYGDMAITICGVEFPSGITMDWSKVSCPDCIKFRPPLFKIGMGVIIKGTNRVGLVTDIYDNRESSSPTLYEKSFYYQLDGGYYWAEKSLVEV